jgi:hypothetical protein
VRADSRASSVVLDALRFFLPNFSARCGEVSRQ